jgi:hypothetical protein
VLVQNDMSKLETPTAVALRGKKKEVSNTIFLRSCPGARPSRSFLTVGAALQVGEIAATQPASNAQNMVVDFLPLLGCSAEEAATLPVAPPFVITSHAETGLAAAAVEFDGQSPYVLPFEMALVTPHPPFVFALAADGNLRAGTFAQVGMAATRRGQVWGGPAIVARRKGAAGSCGRTSALCMGAGNCGTHCSHDHNLLRGSELPLIGAGTCGAYAAAARGITGRCSRCRLCSPGARPAGRGSGSGLRRAPQGELARGWGRCWGRGGRGAPRRDRGCGPQPHRGPDQTASSPQNSQYHSHPRTAPLIDSHGARLLLPRPSASLKYGDNPGGARGSEQQ